MGETEISWTHRPGTVGRSWNPGQGCSRVSAGCMRCYAERLAARFAERGWSQGLIDLRTGKWNVVVRLVPHKLAEPLSWRQPSTVFVNSMTDMFHEGYTNEEIAAVFGVMAATPQHTYQMLTKRAHRMREWFEWIARFDCTAANACIGAGEGMIQDSVGRLTARMTGHYGHIPWPLRNVWLGVSVENQVAADERIQPLLATPAVVRFLSCEPLLDRLDLGWYLDRQLSNQHGDPLPTTNLSWIIAGCESGPRARPCQVEWLRLLRDQCADARVPFFLKQATHTDADLITIGTGSKPKAGGVIELPYLDGVQHAAFPEAR